MARLMEDLGDQWPVFYLVGCYARASDEFRAATTLRSPAVMAAVQAALSVSKQLAVSYSGLLLTMDLFPQARCRPARVSFRSLSLGNSSSTQEGGQSQSFSQVPAS